MKPLQVLLATMSLSVLAACGGGGSSGATGTNLPVSGAISGTVVKGPMSNAAVAAYGISGGQMGTQIAAATTDANGNFTMTIGGYAGPVLLQVSGGSYTDEATGTTMTMAPGDMMTAVMPSIAAGTTNSGVQVTPVTAMAQAMASHMAGGMTDANIAAASTAMGSYFSVSDILHVQPMNSLVTGSGTGASLDAQNYGMTLAAMSKYAQTQGMSSSSSMITALMNDAADGMMDGKAGSASVPMGGMANGMMLPSTAGTSGMGAAMNAFMNSVQNKSGVTAAPLVGKLNGASGQILGAGPKMTNATVSGTTFNGPVSKATVMAFAIDNGTMGAQIASVATDGQGNFTLPLGSYTGAVMLQTSGGTYTDEATQTTMAMGAREVMSAVLPTVASGANLTGVWVTPVTSMAQTRAMGMVGGMTDANIVAANKAMGDYFSVSDVLHIQPMNPMVVGAGTDATQDARNYGMTVAAMSQYAKTLNMTVSSAMVTAMMSDSSDGIMDGKHGAGQISMSMGGMMGTGMMAMTAGTSSLAEAMAGFANSAANASGMRTADMALLIQKLTSSNGHT